MRTFCSNTSRHWMTTLPHTITYTTSNVAPMLFSIRSLIWVAVIESIPYLYNPTFKSSSEASAPVHDDSKLLMNFLTYLILTLTVAELNIPGSLKHFLQLVPMSLPESAVVLAKSDFGDKQAN